MQTTKKIVLIVLVLGTIFGAAFGDSIRIEPKSMTAESTQELFSTDVDDFLNVNEYANVMPSKFFGFLGYGDDGNKAIQLGFAKQLKSIYIAGFFGGMPTVWSSTTEPSGDKKKTTIATTSTDAATGTFLVGFKNMGVSGSFTFKPNATNNRIIDENAKTDITTANFKTNTALKFGMNMNGPKDWVFKSYAELGVEATTNKTTSKNNGTKITGIIDSGSSSDLLLNAGTAFDFFEKDGVTQGVSAGLETKWVIPALKTSRTIKDGKETDYVKKVGAIGAVGAGEGHTIKLNPAYTIAYEPEGKFALRAQASLPLTFDFRSDEDYTERKIGGGNPTKVFTTARKHEVLTNFNPTLAAAFTYRPISKLCLSFGTKFKVPAFGWTTNTTQTRNSSDGKVTKTTNTVTWNFNKDSADFKFEASTGLTWFVTDNVTIDGKWDIAKTLLNNKFKTDLPNGDTKSIFNTINKVLIHNVTFLVSFKL